MNFVAQHEFGDTRLDDILTMGTYGLIFTFQKKNVIIFSHKSLTSRCYNFEILSLQIW